MFGANIPLVVWPSHVLFGHTGGVRFIRPSKFTILYIYRPLIDDFAHYVFGL